MKFLSILAAASLALAPVIASAGSSNAGANGATNDTANDTANTGSADNGGRPISGPLAGRTLDKPIPAGAIALGALVLFGGAVVAFIGKNESNNNTN